MTSGSVLGPHRGRKGKTIQDDDDDGDDDDDDGDDDDNDGDDDDNDGDCDADDDECDDVDNVNGDDGDGDDECHDDYNNNHHHHHHHHHTKGSFLVRTHEGGRGVKQKRTPCLKWEKGCHIRTHKSPFLHILCCIFICNGLLLYFVVFGEDVHYCFVKYF